VACVTEGSLFGPERRADQIDFKSYTVVKRRMTLPKGIVTRDCGPEVVASIFGFYGRKIPVDHISNELYSPQLQGTVVPKLVAYCSLAGFHAVPRRGSIADLRAAVLENRPVIVMLQVNANLAHFLVVAGFSDTERRLVVPHYDDKIRFIPYDSLVQHWEGTDCFLLELIPIDDPYELGERLEKARRFREALAHYEKTVTAEPENYRAWLGMGNCLVQIQETARARDAYERAHALARNDPQLLNNLAHCLVALGERPAEAMELSTRAVALIEGRISNLAAIVEAAADPAEKHARSEELERARSTLGYYYGTLGQSLAANGQWTAAIDAYQKSMASLPATHRAARIQRLTEIAQAYQKLNNQPKAQEYFAKAQALKSGE
jgi:hypothetical protein